MSDALITKHKKSELLELIGHLCVGLSIFMKGLDKLDHHHTVIGIALLFIGLLVIIFSINHKKIEPFLGHIKNVIWGIEGIVMAIIGYTYYLEGTHLLHYAYFLTSILFFCAIPLTYFMQKRKGSSKPGN
jgi:uncharacterized membrane protein HdeD (DUF308 family)